MSLGLSVALVFLGVIFFLNNGGAATRKTAPGGAYAFVVGNPGPGELAPPIQLPSTTGKTFDLAAMHGKTVLLFFQEGLGCQSCWTQIKDMEAQMGSLRALGIDMMVSITTNPLDTLKQEVEFPSSPMSLQQIIAVSLLQMGYEAKGPRRKQRFYRPARKDEEAFAGCDAIVTREQNV